MDNSEKTKEELIIELDESQKRLEELFKNMVEGYAYCRMLFENGEANDFIYLKVNDAFGSLTGLKDATGKRVSEVIPGIRESDPGLFEIYGRVASTGQPEKFETYLEALDMWLSISVYSPEKEFFVALFDVITKRNKTDEVLAREQYFTDALMDTLPDYIYFKDRESKFVRISKSHAESFGLNNPQQAIGKTDFDFFTEKAAKEAYEDEQTILMTGKPVFKEGTLTTRNNDVVWHSMMKLPLRDNAGNIIGTFGISRDITGSKKTEEALKQSEERFRSVAQSANDAIISTDNNGKILLWNKGAENAFGYIDSEAIGQSLNMIIPKEYLDLHISGMARLKAGGEKHVIGKTVELKGLKKNGQIFPIELSLSEWSTSEGTFFTAIVRDITTRKRTELENQIIFEITKGATTTSNLDELFKLIHDSLGKIVYAENCFIALHDKKTGLFNFPYFVDKFDAVPSPTSMGKSCSSYVFRTGKPFLFSREAFGRLNEQGEVELVGTASPSWIGIPLQTPSGTIGVLVLQHYEKKNVFSESDVKFLVSIGSQIAFAIERKKSEEEIKLKNDLLQHLNAEKDKFFSILAHDLRGPMSAFVAATQILTEDIQNMSLEEIREITKSMKNEATNIYGLLENLLEWSRLQRGVLDFSPERLNLSKSIYSGIDSVSASARKKEITIEISVNEDLEVSADSHMFEGVIRNLVSNAVKFTPKGGRVYVSAYMNGNSYPEIKITDTGIGMSPDLKSKLFMLAEKTNRKGTEGEPSSGLGLLLCKEFIEKHGGKIWVESETGKGSTFCFTLSDT